MKKEINENRLLVMASIILLLVIGWICGTTVYMSKTLESKDMEINKLKYDLEYNNYVLEDSIRQGE